MTARPWVLSLAVFSLFISLSPVQGEVTKLEVLRREPFAKGKSFGDVGPYEIIAGVAHFAVDPSHERNRAVVDLDKAPRNDKGKVEFKSDFYILAPKDPAKGNGAIFYDVNNRGNKLALRMFNFAPGGNDLDKPGSEGDGFLMRRGYTIVWCGWIGELLAGENRLLLQPPVATDNGKPIRGMVRFEFTTDQPAKSLPISRRPGHGSYLPTEEGREKAVLTVRLRESDERKPISRDKWSLISAPKAGVNKGVNGTLALTLVDMPDGFQPGAIYELTCECENPIVQGTGILATRDLISFLKSNSTQANPLSDGKDKKPHAKRAYAFGVSQSGRFLRHMLWEGFNEDEQDRIVFDGLIPHVAGGGLGFFNHRFAQPTRHNGQHEDHLYPCDIFPFTYGVETNPFTKQSDGILKIYDKSKNQPKVMHTQSAAEYWHRSGSLVHTDPLGTRDSRIPDNVRVYAFGGTQHGPATGPPTRGFAQNLTNPGDYRPQLRVLLDALDAWVKDGKTPPESVYPRIEDKTLVKWQQADTGFPKIPGIRYPEVIQQPPFADYGPDYVTKGIKEPPVVKGQYVVLVSKTDADGNDLGTLLPAEVAVPLATYTGWNLRRKDVGAEDMLANLLGSYIPFPKTKAEREKTGDPRKSIEERYGNFESYLKQFRANCDAMVARRHLLREDADRLIAGREKVKQMFP